MCTEKYMEWLLHTASLLVTEMSENADKSTVRYNLNENTHKYKIVMASGKSDANRRFIHYYYRRAC